MVGHVSDPSGEGLGTGEKDCNLRAGKKGCLCSKASGAPLDQPRRRRGPFYFQGSSGEERTGIKQRDLSRKVVRKSSGSRQKAFRVRYQGGVPINAQRNNVFSWSSSGER